MKIQVVAVGKLKERFWKEACDEYLKRLKGYAKVRVTRCPIAIRRSRAGKRAARTKEGPLYSGRSCPSIRMSFCSMWAEDSFRAKGMRRAFDALALSGVSEISFIVGGSGGVSQACTTLPTKACLRQITLPHNLARVCCSSKSIGHSKSRVASRIINNWLRRSAERATARRCAGFYAASWLSGFALRSAATRQLASSQSARLNPCSLTLVRIGFLRC